jgi:hypothetical protein
MKGWGKDRSWLTVSRSSRHGPFDRAEGYFRRLSGTSRDRPTSVRKQRLGRNPRYLLVTAQENKTYQCKELDRKRYNVNKVSLRGNRNQDSPPRHQHRDYGR